MSPGPDAIENEVRRQAALLGAILRPGPLPAALRLATAPPQAEAALASWRGNAAAVAERSLGAAFPTVRRMLGDVDFARLASEFRAAAPPTCGDLGEWGGGLPGFVDLHAGLRAWPWLGDTARLDLALHRAGRAADGVCDTASLEALADASPAALRLVFVPGTALLESPWPLATIHAAHAAADADRDAAFSALREAVATKRGESVMIVREGWRPTVHRLDRAGTAWLRSLLAGRSLSDSLDRAGPGFGFAEWLVTAVRGSWLERVVRASADDAAENLQKGVEA